MFATSSITVSPFHFLQYCNSLYNDFFCFHFGEVINNRFATLITIIFVYRFQYNNSKFYSLMNAKVNALLSYKMINAFFLIHQLFMLIRESRSDPLIGFLDML